MHSKQNTLRTLLALAITAALLATSAKMADAKTFVVNKRGDHAPGKCTKSDCTLREAVMAASSEPSDDKVKLPSTAPYLLKREAGAPGPDRESGDLDVGAGVGFGNKTTIVHPGSGRATVDASATGDRVIELLGNLELKRLKLTGGAAEHGEQSGGGVNGRGVLILRDSVVAKNTAPDVGGGVFMADGAFYAMSSRISKNSAGNGGAFYIGEDARADLAGTTVDHNVSDGTGGAAWLETEPLHGTNRLIGSTFEANESGADGGAIANRTDEVVIENSTFAGNEADGRGGAIYAAPDSSMRVNAATIVANRADADGSGPPASGGGVYADGGSDVVQIRNSLLATNRVGLGGTVNECDAPAPVGIDSRGGNLITTTLGGCTYFDHGEDIVAANPRIKELADNGGPTKTIALRAASPAIDEADGPSPPVADQRGETRSDPDIGAYER